MKAAELSQEVFLSTPSARRATDRRAESAEAAVISIHALREEGDPVIELSQYA